MLTYLRVELRSIFLAFALGEWRYFQISLASSVLSEQLESFVHEGQDSTVLGFAWTRFLQSLSLVI